jgi:hypothetical protein
MVKRKRKEALEKKRMTALAPLDRNLSTVKQTP